MTVISDAEFDRAAELAPNALLRYLRGRGWSPLRDYGRGQLWVLPVPGDPAVPYEVMVPLDRRPRDYADRVADVLETLSAVEARRPGEVLREIALPPADWQYLRLLPPGPSGTAPLVDLVPALTGLKELMTAAAAAALAPEPQPVQPSQKPQRVKDFVSSVRLDQTRVGSYVIAAHTPLPEPPPQSGLIFDDFADESRREPFERLVSRRLYAGVLCAHQAAKRTLEEDSLEDFAQYASAGVSANLCEALVRIAGEDRRTYELSWAWSGELPVEQETPPVSIPTLLIPALEAGAKDLRARLGQREDELDLGRSREQREVVAVTPRVVAEAQEEPQAGRVEELHAPKVDDETVDPQAPKLADLALELVDRGEVEVARGDDGDLLALRRDAEGERIGGTCLRCGHGRRPLSDDGWRRDVPFACPRQARSDHRKQIGAARSEPPTARMIVRARIRRAHSVGGSRAGW